MYSHFDSMLALCRERDWPLWKVICAEEQELNGQSEEKIFDRMEWRYTIMARSASAALDTPQPGHTGQPTLITGVAQAQAKYAAGAQTLCGPMLNRVMARALSCSEYNASMGRICAMPTAGACGIVPAVLLTLEEERSLPPSEGTGGSGHCQRRGGGHHPERHRLRSGGGLSGGVRRRRRHGCRRGGLPYGRHPGAEPHRHESRHD